MWAQADNALVLKGFCRIGGSAGCQSGDAT